MRANFTCKITSKSVDDKSIVIALTPVDATVLLESNMVQFVQTEAACRNAIAIDRMGGVTCKTGTTSVTLVATIDGVTYNASAALNPTTCKPGDTVNFTRAV